MTARRLEFHRKHQLPIKTNCVLGKPVARYQQPL